MMALRGITQPFQEWNQTTIPTTFAMNLGITHIYTPTLMSMNPNKTKIYVKQLHG